jgi:allophanate hydrolase
MSTAHAAAERSLAATESSDRSEVWIARANAPELLAEADRIDARVGAGEVLPLAGLTFAVKDNIDVAGLATTAGCPAFAYLPDADARPVRALREAGALCVGKTNLDQFATGLVGARSPYGPVRSAANPELIAGGSSSGSAVAVALGMVDLALGTDTAGSGRVPAALNGVVGFKATVGLVSTAGVVPACRSFDCVTVFAGDLELAEASMAVLTGPWGAAPDRRAFPGDMPLAPPDHPVVAVPERAALGSLAPGWADAFCEACERLAQSGCALVPIDLTPFVAAGRLLYDGAFVAERFAAVGEFVVSHRQDVDPTVGDVIARAGDIGAADLAADQAALDVFGREARAEWALAGADSLLLPTTTRHPALAEVAADPIGVNTQLGLFTTFVNLLDMCAVAVPSGRVGDGPFGVSCVGPAFSDLVQLEIARRVTTGSVRRERRFERLRLGPPSVPLAVVGAHLRGQPLNEQLTRRGARLRGRTRTAPCYRLRALATEPPKPGLERVGAGGASIEVEIWELAPVRFADFVAAVPPPMAIGTVVLEDGASVLGFLCEPVALDGAPDISGYGGWRAYLDSAGTLSK